MKRLSLNNSQFFVFELLCDTTCVEMFNPFCKTLLYAATSAFYFMRVQNHSISYKSLFMYMRSSFVKFGRGSLTRASKASPVNVLLNR